MKAQRNLIDKEMVETKPDVRRYLSLGYRDFRSLLVLIFMLSNMV